MSRSKFSEYVVHCKKAPYDIYAGRPGPWGNPFTVKEFGRDEAIAMYRAWLMESLEGQRVVMLARKELRGKILGCWCAPNPCHAEVLAEIANGL